jgi:predicted DNA-binding transcriptional regulator AlpA
MLMSKNRERDHSAERLSAGSVTSEHDLIDTKSACKVIGGAARPIHPSTLIRLAKQGLLPSPVRIGSRIRRWSRTECEALARRCKEPDPAT